MNKTLEAENFFEEIFASADSDPVFVEMIYHHSKNLAVATRKIAEQMVKNGVKTVDPDEAYICALLHDIGKTRKEFTGLNHPVKAYRMLMEKGWEVPARIAMTHTYYGYAEIDRSDFWERFSGTEEELQFTKEYMQGVKLEDLDLLVQLLDNMVHTYGVMSIADRFCDIQVRHHTQNGGQHLRVLYKLKMYFDEKCGMNIYEMFRDDIIQNCLETPNRDLKRHLKKEL